MLLAPSLVFWFLVFTADGLLSDKNPLPVKKNTLSADKNLSLKKKNTFSVDKNPLPGKNALPVEKNALRLKTDVLSVDMNDFVYNSKLLTSRAKLLDKNGQLFSKFPQKAFTFCFFAYLDFKAGQSAMLVSYASREVKQANEVFFQISYDKTPFSILAINAMMVRFPKVPAVKEWTHICASWNSASGNFHMFMNGTEVHGKVKTLKKDYKIGGDGCLVLGQHQDSLDGGYDPKQGMKGRMTQFNLWDRELSAQEVKAVMNCASSGNVVDWSKSKWEFADGLKVESSTSPCFNARGISKSATPALKQEGLIKKADCTQDSECENCPNGKVKRCKDGSCICLACGNMVQCPACPPGKKFDCRKGSCYCDDCYGYYDCDLAKCAAIGKRRICNNDHKCACEGCTNPVQCADCPAGQHADCRNGTCYCNECYSYVQCDLAKCAAMGKRRTCNDDFKCACEDCTNAVQCADCPAGQHADCRNGSCYCNECNSYPDCDLAKCAAIGKKRTCNDDYKCTCEDCTHVGQCADCPAGQHADCRNGTCYCNDCTNPVQCADCPAGQHADCRNGSCYCNECNSYPDCDLAKCAAIGKKRTCNDDYKCTCEDCTHAGQCADCPAGQHADCRNGTCYCSECNSYPDCDLAKCAAIGKKRTCNDDYKCTCEDCTHSGQCADCPAGTKVDCRSGTCYCDER